MSLLIKNGRIVLGGRVVKRNILVEDGKISKISEQRLEGDSVINARDTIVLPGLIDSHVHFRDPGLTYKEDFVSGSHSAAAGGVTTVLDMPNTIPPTFTVADLENKRIVARKSVVNYGFHFGASPEGNLEEIKKAENISSVKIYLGETTGNLIVTDFKFVEKVLQIAPFVSIHAENSEIQKTIEIAERLSRTFYLCHTSSAEDLALADKNRAYVFVEATPHHLFLTESEQKKLGGLAFVKPELKKEKDRRALWKGIDSGVVDTIGTDHAPHTVYEKNTKKIAGVPGVETMLPLLLNAVNERKLKLPDVVRLCAENPASIFKIRGKGRMKLGYDADLTIVDMNLEKKVRNNKLHTKCKWSPFHNKTLKGWPVTTIVNGKVVFDDDQIHDIPGKEVQFR